MNGVLESPGAHEKTPGIALRHIAKQVLFVSSVKFPAKMFRAKYGIKSSHEDLVMEEDEWRKRHGWQSILDHARVCGCVCVVCQCTHTHTHYNNIQLYIHCSGNNIM